MGSELRDREPSSVLEAWRQGYVRINRLFADAVIDELMRRGDSATVMLHDYHLYLVPTLIRRVVPKVLLQHFIHIPWPAPEEWKALPPGLVRQICRSLLENDSLGFQTDEHAANFIATCEEYLENDLNHSGRPWQLNYAGRAVNIWSNPISVEVSHLRELAASREVQRYREALIARPSVEKTIMRTDRLDPAKNVLAGFEAYDRLLERAPELHGRVRFVAFLVPSRCGIPEYDDYAARVFELVESINSRYGTAGWTPVEVHHEQNRSQALAGLMDYDVLLVNSLADGMNLVSKEGPVVNERDGVLVLSVRAGSYHQLQDGALSVDPVDVAATADALEAALALGPERRREGARTLRDAIEMHQLSDWLRHLIKDLEVIGSLRTRPRALLAG
jgi:trehalose 6-phosphate synthase